MTRFWLSHAMDALSPAELDQYWGSAALAILIPVIGFLLMAWLWEDDDDDRT